MKTNEFIKEAKKLGFKASVEGSVIEIKNNNGRLVSLVYLDEIFTIDTDFSKFNKLDKDKKSQLFKLLVEYSSTPIKERKEEKKYKYRLKDKVKGITLKDSQYTFLSYKESDNKWYLSNGCNLLKTQFTHSWLVKHGIDIEQLQEFYDEIEVKE